jgi:hypothetical protein
VIGGMINFGEEVKEFLFSLEASGIKKITKRAVKLLLI